MNMGFVVVMGIVTVFVCLIALIIIIEIMGKIVNSFASKNTAPVPAPAAAPQAAAPQASVNKQQLVAVMSAAIAEEMGTDVSHIRIHSIKKI